MKLPSTSGKTSLHVFKEVINFLRASRIVSVTGGRLQESPNGTRLIIDATSSGTTTGSSTRSTCNFGSIKTNDADPPEKVIIGGLLVCGDKNFAVDDYVIDTATDGEWLVQIKLSGITCASDDDNEIFLPGVTTSSGDPTWDLKVKEEGTDYDDNTNPTSPSGTGSIVVPIGILKITDEVPNLLNLGCGNITIGQCAGILNFSRA